MAKLDAYVHFVDGLEGSTGITNDVGMRKVGIGYEPFVHTFSTFLFETHKIFFTKLCNRIAESPSQIASFLLNQ